MVDISDLSRRHVTLWANFIRSQVTTQPSGHFLNCCHFSTTVFIVFEQVSRYEEIIKKLMIM